MTQSKAVVDYRTKDEDLKTGRYTNIPIASYTTAYARIELYKVMEQLGERLLYCDTDSVVFITEEGQKNPPVGSFLGELTDEIRDAYGSDARGISFVSSGPKTYALDVLCPNGKVKSIVRCKGFTLKNENADLVTSETLKQLVTKKIDKIETKGKLFKPYKYGGVSLIDNNKTLRETYSKRRIVDQKSFRTLPWGFNDGTNK